MKKLKPETLRGIVEAIPDGLVVIEAGGGPVYVNRTVRDIFDIAKNMEGLDLQIKGALEEDPMAFDEPVQLDAVIDDSLYQVFISPLYEGRKKTGAVLLIRDASVLKQAQDIKTDFVSIASHELRNPLTVIGGFANLMLSSGNQDGNGEYLNIILSEAKRAESVLNQVLDFSRASRTKTRPIDFNHLTKQTFELLVSRLKHTIRPPKLNISENTLSVWGNPDQLQHALFQFMNMTIEELTGECQVRYTTMSDNGMARFGIGFEGADEALARVKKTLRQIFGSSTGTQKLSIIVAGETIKYHGGGYGLAEGSDRKPEIYIELPEYKGENDA